MRFKLFITLKQYSFYLKILILKYTNYYSCLSQFSFKILNLKYRVLLIKKEFLKKLLISVAVRPLTEKVIAYSLFYLLIKLLIKEKLRPTKVFELVLEKSILGIRQLFLKIK